MTTLKQQYKTEIVPSLMEELGYKNINAVPKIEKVVINAGVGKHHKEKDYLDKTEAMLARITGQKPSRRLARKSIAGFKLRDGAVVGMQVTLRGPRMYDFLERLTRVVFPRMRDFRGISKKGFDGRGNYTYGLKEVGAFPEATPQDIDLGQGLQITVSTTAVDNKEGTKLLRAIGFPFIKKTKKSK